MDLKACYEIAAPEVAAEDFGGEIVVLNLSDGRYFSLRGVAATLWRDACAGCAPEAIVNAVREADEVLAQKVADCFAELVETGLLRPRPQAVSEVSAVPASVSELLAGREGPVIEAFDDMADLILSDPIHDVEEDIGWPVRREV